MLRIQVRVLVVAPLLIYIRSAGVIGNTTWRMIRDEDVGSNPILAFFTQQVSTGIETVFGRMQSRCIGRVAPLDIAVSIIG